MANEKPSARIRAIAGRVLRMAATGDVKKPVPGGIIWSNLEGKVTVADLKSLAGFVVNASPDKPKRKAVKK